MPMVYSTEPEQIILKIVWNHRRPQIAKTILRKDNKAGGIILPLFQVYYKAIVIQTVWYWSKNRHTDQKHRTENPDINFHTHGQLNYRTNNIKCRNDSPFNKQHWGN